MRTPVSTYRLQIRPGFTLQDAAQTVPYLKSLGVDWIYLSPILTAEQGSDHGYDVTDYSRLNPEIGSEEDLQALSAELRKHDLGLVVDVVPNHMAVGGPENRLWWDVLKCGQRSPAARYFDTLRGCNA